MVFDVTIESNFRAECGERPALLQLEVPVWAWTLTEILMLVGVVSIADSSKKHKR